MPDGPARDAGPGCPDGQAVHDVNDPRDEPGEPTHGRHFVRPPHTTVERDDAALHRRGDAASAAAVLRRRQRCVDVGGDLVIASIEGP